MQCGGNQKAGTSAILAQNSNNATDADRMSSHHMEWTGKYGHHTHSTIIYRSMSFPSSFLC